MISPWRTATLAVALAFGLATSAFAQAPAPAPNAPPPTAAPKTDTPPPAATPKVDAPAPAKQPLGEAVTLAPKTIIYFKGNGEWNNALDVLQDAFKSVYAFLEKQGIQRAGPPMTIYTDFDDTNFSFQAAVPVAEAPKDPPKGDIAVGQTPAGKAMKFSYRGSFHQMEDTIYNAIPEFLDEKQLESSGTFIEEYATDPVTTPEDKFEITIYVILK